MKGIGFPKKRLLSKLTLSCIMLKNNQMYFKNLAEWTSQDLKYVWPYFNIMLERAKWKLAFLDLIKK